MELWAIIPELVLASAFLVLLAAAPFVRRGMTVIYVVAVVTVIVSVVFTTQMEQWPVQSVFHGTYVIDPLAHFLKIYAAVAVGLTALACLDAFAGNPFQADIPALLVAAALGAAMLAGSLDVALVVLFFQIVAVSTLILVGLTKDDKASNEAALKYFLFGAAAVAVMLFGFSLLYGLTASTLVTTTAAGWPSTLSLFAFAVILVGFGFKMTLVPFHMWAPDVYDGAPAPIAGLLSVLPKAAAVAVVLRLLSGAFLPIAAYWRLLLEIVAVLTMTVGNVWALRQDSVKRLLAYSSIAQMGYILVGIAVSSAAPEAGSAVLFYLLVYLFMNLGAFFVAARLERYGNARQIPEYAGLSSRAPALAFALTIFLLSLAGVPPLAGYVGKVLLVNAALKGGAAWLAVALAANVVLAAYYYLRVIGAMYLGEPEHRAALTSARWLDGSIAIALLATLLLGILPERGIKWSVKAAGALSWQAGTATSHAGGR